MTENRYIKKFSPAVTEAIGYYVYTLADPITTEIFYVGKGRGNRIFDHVNFSLKSPKESDKLNQIRAIRDRGEEVLHYIHRHGLTEKEAFEIEAALIDLVGLNELANRVAGQHSAYRGKMSVSEVVARYEAPQIMIQEPALLITVNRLYFRGITPPRLYEITRGNWVLGERREKVQLAIAVYHGIVRQVYRVHSWHTAKARDPKQKTRARWRFKGEVAEDFQHYVGGDVSHYLTQGAQNPIKYLNLNS